MRKKSVRVALLSFGVLALGLAVYFAWVSAAEISQEFDLEFDIPVQLNGAYYDFDPNRIPKNLDISSPDPNYIIDRYEIFLHGVKVPDESSLSSLDGTTLTFTSPGAYKKETTVYGRSETDPGHIVWRNSAGTTWETQGEGTGKYYISNTGDVGCVGWKIPGVSDCPGPFPSNIPPVLQNNGDAVTTSNRIPPPDYFYENEEDAKKNSQNNRIPLSAIDRLRLHIDSNKTEWLLDGIRVLGGGAGEYGFGMLQVARRLDGTHNKKAEIDDYTAGDYFDITHESGTPVTGYTQGRNYFMPVNAAWEAETYKYAGKVRVYYKPASKPNLVATELINTQPLQLNVPVQMRYAFENRVKRVEQVPFDVLIVKGSPDSFTQILKTITITDPIEPGETVSGTFSYTFTQPGSVQWSLIIDPDNRVNEETKADNAITRTFNVVPGKPVGDFDIVPPVITYRDSFTLVPKNFDMGPGCAYQYHIFEFTNGPGWQTPQQTSPAQQLKFVYPDYPHNLVVGANPIRMKIVSSCAESDWVEHTLIVNPPSGNNGPPVFDAGWFPAGHVNAIEPVTTVVQGTLLDLRIIRDPTRNPPTPYDPDGDPIEWYWDFYGSDDAWIRSLPGKYNLKPTNERHSNILADTVGTFSVWVTGKDPFGGSSKRLVTLTVVPPNPVPWATCPPEWKEHRPIPEGKIHANRSYSPYPDRTINHSLDEWINKQSSYDNPTNGDITVTVILKSVTDSAGLKSLPGSESSCQIIIHPDKPPVAQLQVPPMALREQNVFIRNTSYSPDGDAIVSAKYFMKYDGNNNGFADDPLQELAGGDLSGIWYYTGDLVGKRAFYVVVTEEYGETADNFAVDVNTVTLDVVNRAPEVSFRIEGSNPQPEVNPPVAFSPEAIYNGWELYQVNSTNAILDRARFWEVSGGYLQGKSGKNYGGQQQSAYRSYQLPSWEWYYLNGTTNDNGLGANGMSPFRAIGEGPVLNTLLLDPERMEEDFIQAYYTGRIYTQYTQDVKLRSYGNIFLFKYYNRYGGFSGIYAIDLNRLSPLQLDPYGNPSYTDEYPLQYHLPVSTGIWRYHPGADDPDLVEIEDFEVANQYLYVIRSSEFLGGKEETYDEEGNPDGEYYNIQYKVREIALYDVQTGQEIRNTYNAGITVTAGTPTQTFAKGDNLVVVTEKGMYEYNPQLELVRWVEFPPVPEAINPGRPGFSCDGYRKGRTKLFQDAKGNFYYYEYTVCYDDRGTDTLYWPREGNATVVKYDSNFQFQWRSHLSGGVPFTGSWFRDMRDTARGADEFAVLMETNDFANPSGGTILARSYYAIYNGGWDFTAPVKMVDMLDINTGQIVATWGEGSPYDFNLWTAKHLIDWQGNYIGVNENQGSAYGEKYGGFTADGYYTKRNAQSISIYDPAGNKTRDISVMTWGYSPQYLQFGEYFGDGVYVYYIMHYTPEHQSKRGIALGFVIGNPTTAPLVFPRYMLGQYVSPGTVDGDAEIHFTMRMAKPAADTNLAGFSFKMADPRNRLAVETDGSTVYLSRYDDGNRTVLANSPYAFGDNADYAFTIRTTGSQVQVEINDVPYLTASTAFPGGKVGPFADKPYTGFTGMYWKRVITTDIEWLTNYAILENGHADVRYVNLTYRDPENDPRYGAYEWHFQHQIGKFLDNMTYSWLNGQTVYSETPWNTFDQIGVYDITMEAKDDPHPWYRGSAVFDNYRKTSNPYLQRLIVHRRPVAEFTLWTNGDGTIGWNDASYDPDRYNRWTGACTPPDATGYNYCANRGILERKYSYVTPSGQYVEGKLVRPTEAGTYTVFLQVRDEYGAWSYPAQQTIWSAGGVPQNEKPTVQLTFPTGGLWNPTRVYTTRPTITWNQWDTPGTIFQGYAVRIMNETGAVVLESGEAPQWTTGNSAAWTVTMDLARGVKYQVQVKVSDGEQWSDWSNIGWMIVNSPPAVTITSPDGQSKDAPTMIFDNLRPVIGWVQSDPDWNRWNKFYMEILDVYGNRVYDTGWTARQDTSSPTNAFQIPVDLPTLVPLQARMRVTDDDDNLWSDWSNTVWFFLDRTPAAEVIVPNGTQVNPTPMSPTPTIQFNEWDPDPGNVFTKYQVRFISENGGTVYHDSGEVSQNVVGQWGGGLSYAIPEDRPLPAGAKVQVRVRVYDGYIWSAWSASTWLVTNRPPVADFDWTPKPVWEGDAVTLLNHSVDPDGDALTSFWRIQRPDGSVVTGTNWNMASVFELAGDYTVTLTVSDGKADASTTRVIRAQELTIRSEVNHTAAWLVHHQKRGHNVTTPPKDFYSGEIFVVETNSSPAPVSWARAWIDTTGLDGQRLQVETMLAAAGSPTHFAGELFDERFLSMTKGLPKGRMEIHFQICYANGVIRQESVPVNIIGNANASFTVHRRQ